jgi:hypothetical protein
MESFGVITVSISPRQENTRICAGALNALVISFSEYPAATIVLYLPEFLRAELIISLTTSEDISLENGKFFNPRLFELNAG